MIEHARTQQSLDLIETYIYQGSNTGSWETEYVTHQIMDGDQLLNSSPADPGPLPHRARNISTEQISSRSWVKFRGPQHSLQGFLLLTLSPPASSPPNPSLQPLGLCIATLSEFLCWGCSFCHQHGPFLFLSSPLGLNGNYPFLQEALFSLAPEVLVSDPSYISRAGTYQYHPAMTCSHSYTHSPTNTDLETSTGANNRVNSETNTCR